MDSYWHNKGENNPFYGKKHSIESREKMSRARKGDCKFYWTKDWLYHQYIILEKSTGEIAKEQNCNAETIRVRLEQFGINRRHPSESIKTIHRWVKKRKLKPKFCEICNKTSPLDLMCLDHKYRRNIEDYKYACRSCHMKYDHKMGFRGEK